MMKLLQRNQILADNLEFRNYVLDKIKAISVYIYIYVQCT